MKCDCHNKNHHDDKLTLLPADCPNGDPAPSIPGAPPLVVWCDKGLRERGPRIEALERARRAYSRRRAA
jgi:hypothetical protein